MDYLYNNQSLKHRRQKLRRNAPEPEQKLWYWLRGRNLKGYKFRRQYGVGNYIIDFYCPQLRLGIEIDGDSHFVDFKTRTNDENREKYLLSQSIRILRFTNIEIQENLEEVVNKITKYLS
jgi:very-short-patch-repair endonuclease